MKKSVIAVAALALALSACTDDPADEEPTEDTVETSETTVESTGGLIEPRSDLTELQSAVIDVTEVDEDTLRIEFEMGSPECQGVNVILQENSDEVAVGVQTGLIPGKTFDDCEDAGTNFYYTEVDTAEPIGDRALRAAEEVEPS